MHIYLASWACMEVNQLGEKVMMLKCAIPAPVISTKRELTRIVYSSHMCVAKASSHLWDYVEPRDGFCYLLRIPTSYLVLPHSGTPFLSFPFLFFSSFSTFFLFSPCYL